MTEIGNRKEDFGTTTALIPDQSMTGDQRSEPAAHTPGPWAVYDMNPTTVLANRYSLNAFAVADCSPTVRASTEDEAEANARLIAAAPDLLAALTALRWRSVSKDNMEFDCSITCYEMDKILAAIAKAEGRS